MNMSAIGNPQSAVLNRQRAVGTKKLRERDIELRTANAQIKSKAYEKIYRSSAHTDVI
jgi:hypothetical protein